MNIKKRGKGGTERTKKELVGTQVRDTYGSDGVRGLSFVQVDEEKDARQKAFLLLKQMVKRPARPSGRDAELRACAKRGRKTGPAASKPVRRTGERRGTSGKPPTF